MFWNIQICTASDCMLTPDFLQREGNETVDDPQYSTKHIYFGTKTWTSFIFRAKPLCWVQELHDQYAQGE